ncbi:hypothetical protein Ntsu_61180 [Nocardia sp. IFM 10818]
MRRVELDLIKTFTAEEYASGLESWAWLGLEGKTPMCSSLFGDVFFLADDGVWWLDTITGELTHEWGSVDEVEAALNSEEGQDKYLLAGLALAVAETGLVPAENQIYDFSHPPVLGGELDVENIEVATMDMSLNMLGQIHDQVRGLPPGTEISGIEFD